MTDTELSGAELRRSITAVLRLSPRVIRMAAGATDADAEEVASEAADSLVDIRNSAELLRIQLVPKLLAMNPGGEECDEVLDYIAEELRHIHYHILNTKLFSYIVVK